MGAASIEVKYLNKPGVFTCPRPSVLLYHNSKLRFSTNFLTKNLGYTTSRRSIKSCTIVPYSSRTFFNMNTPLNSSIKVKSSAKCEAESVELGFTEVLVRRGVVLLAAMICGVLVLWCQRAVAVEGVVNVGHGVVEQGLAALRSSRPQVLQVLRVFKEQGLVLAALLGLSAFFSMAETSITTLWPWKVRELAEKEPDNGVFNMLRRDVTRFLTTILIDTTVVNIGATALVTEAANAIFGEAGVSAATGVMTISLRISRTCNGGGEECTKRLLNLNSL